MATVRVIVGDMRETVKCVSDIESDDVAKKNTCHYRFIGRRGGVETRWVNNQLNMVSEWGRVAVHTGGRLLFRGHAQLSIMWSSLDLKPMRHTALT